MKQIRAFVMFIVIALVAGCAATGTERLANDTGCPVADISTARRIAVVVIENHADRNHLSQAGYRLDVSDEGRFWLALDGPHSFAQTDSIVVQAGGSSFQFRIAKCHGAISDFKRTGWR